MATDITAPEPLGCPYCNRPPIASELVPSKVWSLRCAWSVHHSFYVMSWESAEDCIRRWNGRYSDQEHSS